MERLKTVVDCGVITGILISLTLHVGAIVLVYALSSSIVHPARPIEIDFTLAEPIGPPLPEPPAAAPKPRREPQAPGRKVPAPVTGNRRPLAEPPMVARTPLPRESATEPQGSVPVFAGTNPTPPGPAQQAASPSAGGSGGGSTTGSAQAAGGGNGISSDQLRGGYRSEHFAYIKKIIEENLTYPPRARRLGWSGNCVVEFVVQANGHAKDIRVIKSTGYELLDDNVIETIKKVAPFPKPPIPVKLTIPFTYSLG